MRKQRGKLFISGGGNSEESFLLDKKFVSSLKKKNILYIPIGLRRDLIGYEDCYEWITKTLSAHTKKSLDIEMWISLKGVTKEDILNFEAIYIGGGRNTYKLLYNFYRTGFIDLLKEFFHNGGIVYGGSAGAVIMGKSIATVSEENDKMYPFEEGLYLLNNYSICCHFNARKEKLIYKFISNHNSPVIAIPEDSGLILEYQHFLVIGYSHIELYDTYLNKSIIKPGESFSLEEGQL